MLVVVVICIFYLVPQYQGAGLTLKTLLGTPVWLGPLAVGAIVLTNVVAGGMRSITFVQAFQYWLKLTAVAIPALALAGCSSPTAAANSAGRCRRPCSRPPPSRSTPTSWSRSPNPAASRSPARWTGGRLLATPSAPPAHRLSAGSTLTLAAGAATPVVAGAPSTGADWIASGGGLGGDHPLYQVVSIMVATFLGTMGLPHVLVRFYTNPDGRAARRTALAVIALLSLFYLFPTLLGVFSRLYVPQLLITGAADAAVLLAPGSAIGGPAGQLLAALVAAGAIAAFLATSSGLLVSFAGALATDVLAGRVRDFRIAAVIGGVIPIPLALAASGVWSFPAVWAWPSPSRRRRCARCWCSASGGAVSPRPAPRAGSRSEGCCRGWR